MTFFLFWKVIVCRFVFLAEFMRFFFFFIFIAIGLDDMDLYFFPSSFSSFFFLFRFATLFYKSFTCPRCGVWMFGFHWSRCVIVSGISCALPPYKPDSTSAPTTYLPSLCFSWGRLFESIHLHAQCTMQLALTEMGLLPIRTKRNI